MQHLRQSTASQEISLGQFLDSADGNTEEGGLTIANTDIKIRKHGGTTLINKTSGGATVISNGVYQAVLDATDTDTAGMLEIYVHVAGALAVKSVYMVLTATAFDALYTGTYNNFDAANDDVAVVTLVGTTTTNTDMVGTDGALTDKAGFSLSATGLDLIASTATGMVNLAIAVWDRVLTGGTHNINNSAGRRLRQLSGPILSAGTLDAATASTVDLETGVASTVNDFHLHDRIIITAGTGVGQSRIITSYVGTGSVAGVAPNWVTTPDNTSEYEVFPGSVHTETQKNGYTNSSIHIASSGVSGTVPYNNGIEDNPLDDGTLSDAVALDAVLGYNHYTLGKGATITLASSYTSHIFNGIGGVIALNGQSTSFCSFNNCVVSGIQTGAGRTFWEDARLNGPSTITDAAMFNCSINGTITLSDTGDYSLNQCVATNAAIAPVFDFGAVGNQELNLQGWNGPVSLSNVGNTGTDSVIITGSGEVTINSSCTGGTIKIIGDFIVTDNSAGSTVTYDDNTSNIVLTLADTNELQSDDVPGLIAALPDAAEVNAEMVDVMETDTHTEPAAVVGATASLKDAIMWNKTLGRNKMTQTATTTLLRNDADSGTISTSTVSDDTTTFIKGKHT